jgi:hypothetical protein
MAGERHGMCESVFKTAGEQQGNGMVCVNPSLKRRGNGMGTAWERHGMCESALTPLPTDAFMACKRTTLP